MSNHLTGQSSPYLLQHVENPVDWYPWGEKAFRKAEEEDKPVFLSVGYSTCHWCHVMAHESFEDQETAELLNKYFISIKVDREERPDIDSVYMKACQEMTGSGGWPMSIFMTAQQKPFYAGTYFPPEARHGIPGFCEILKTIADQWKKNRQGLLAMADRTQINLSQTDPEGSLFPSPYLPQQAAAYFAENYDEGYGGFGHAPKFPTPHNLLFLLLYAQTEADREGAARAVGQVKETLEKMRRGGIFDQIGFGFSRYSTDRRYLVPHFEKMLYDNALLILACAAVYKVSMEELFLETAEQTAEYVLREMRGPDGGFYSAQDADSEGGEGVYYLWTKEEILHILGKEKGEEVSRYYGITGPGNFEGKNIPNLLHGGEISDPYKEERQKLYEYRRSRASLHLDDKILTAWNSLMICAMSVLYRVTGKRCYLEAAERAQQYVERYLAEGVSLYVSSRDKVRSVKGFLDDYACYTAALIHLYDVTEKPEYRERAQQVCAEAVDQFGDLEEGGYYLYGTKNDSLILRPKESYDGALPSGNSVMAYCLVRLSQICGDEDYEKEAQWQLAWLSAEAERYPAGHSMFLTALLMYDHPPMKITAVLAEGRSREEIMPRLPLYADIRILKCPTEDYQLLNEKTTYYVCRDHTCFPPTNQISDFTTS
jgi:Highly conserved protein containing a thioredoxin domain